MTRIDLHVHTTASDGTLAPEQVVLAASALGIDVIGITDHDTTDGLAEAIETAQRVSTVKVIPGVELSATAPVGGDLHLLGYCIDPASEPLQHALNRFRRDRQTRMERIVSRLREHGVPITVDDIERQASGGAISRAHVGRALIELGVVDTVDEAFAIWLGRGKPGFYPRVPLHADDAIRLVRDAGGIPVLAHPLTMGDFRKQLPYLLESGLVGIEVYYGPYDDHQRALLGEVADAYGLIRTGGSDFHGRDHREGRDLGGVDVPASVLKPLRRMAPACLS